jgi:hypothetical protein
MSQPEFSPVDLQNLQYAKRLLERPSLAARIANIAGVPIEMGFEILPNSAKEIIATAIQKALLRALHFAVATMSEGQQSASNLLHKAAVMVSGAAGGTFGIPALPIELPVSTTIMLRSIMDVARSEGEVIQSAEARLACLEVFALGGRARTDDATDAGYYFVRTALAKAVMEAAEYIAERTVVEESAPPLLRLIAQIGTRFGIQVSEKATAQALPIIGLAGGAMINAIFIDHFQDMARGHFIVRRLERAYGEEAVKAAYSSILLD